MLQIIKYYVCIGGNILKITIHVWEYDIKTTCRSNVTLYMMCISIEKGKTVGEERTEAIIQLLTSFGCSVDLLQSCQQLSVAHVPALFALCPLTLPKVYKVCERVQSPFSWLMAPLPCFLMWMDPLNHDVMISPRPRP